jgi:ribosome-associated heat shock protein Hsp15
MPNTETGTQRLDKWLWHARIGRTRSLAAQLVSNGKIRVNRERVTKPAHAVKQGDVITAALGGRVLVLKVEGFADHRGPATEARGLYTNLTPGANGGDSVMSEDDTPPPQGV